MFEHGWDEAIVLDCLLPFDEDDQASVAPGEATRQPIVYTTAYYFETFVDLADRTGSHSRVTFDSIHEACLLDPMLPSAHTTPAIHIETVG